MLLSRSAHKKKSLLSLKKEKNRHGGGAEEGDTEIVVDAERQELGQAGSHGAGEKYREWEGKIMKQKITGEETGVKMGQGSLPCLFKNPVPAEKQAKEFAEEITKSQERCRKSGDVFFENEDGQEQGEEENRNRGEFPPLLIPIDAFYLLEEKEIDSRRHEADEIEKEKEQRDAADRRQGLLFIREEIKNHQGKRGRPKVEPPADDVSILQR